MKAKLALLVAGILLLAGSLTAQTPKPEAPPAPGAVAAPQAPGAPPTPAAPYAPQAPAAAPAPPAPPRPPHDPIGDALLPPELVMRHQQAIGLTSEQKTYIRDQVRQAQLRFTELQWQLEDAAEALRTLLEKDRVDEPQALNALERVLDAERQIKTAQITLMVRIKNRLTPEQQTKLRELRGRGPWGLEGPAATAPPPPRP